MTENILLKTSPAVLETWMREFYFSTALDIGSSGVESFSWAELRALLNLEPAELDQLVFADSQTLGQPALREAIARRWGNGDATWVMATQGSSEAIFLTMNALLRPGDEVVVMAPCYQQLFALAEAQQCKLKYWQLRAEQGFVPEVADLKRQVSRQTRMIVLNFPHNPTGATITAAEQAEVLKTAAAVGAYLVWDGAFAELTYEAPALPNPILHYERAIAFGTLSKAYGLPGLRVGWCFASPPLLRQFAHLRDYTILHLSVLTEFLAQRAIEQAEFILKNRLEQARANKAILTGWIKDQAEAVSWSAPQGGVCAFPRLNQVPDVTAFCRHLAEHYHTLLVPGSCFNQPQHVRLGFGGATAELTAGLANLAVLLRSHSGSDEQVRR